MDNFNLNVPYLEPINSRNLDFDSEDISKEILKFYVRECWFEKDKEDFCKFLLQFISQKGKGNLIQEFATSLSSHSLERTEIETESRPPCSFCGVVSETVLKKCHRIDKIRQFLGNTESKGRLGCTQCFKLIGRIQRSLRSDNGVISVGVVGEINSWRVKNKLPPLYKRHYKEKKNISEYQLYFEKYEEIRSGRFADRSMLEKCREESPHYDQTGFDIISTRIEMTVLEKLLEEKECEKCRDGYKIKSYQTILKNQIKSKGVVSQIPMVCQLGHSSIFHCSSYIPDSKNEYLLNRIESFAVSASNLSPTNLYLKNTLAGEPGFSYTETSRRNTSFFKFIEFGKNENFDEVRRKYVIHNVNLFIGCRYFYILLGLLKEGKKERLGEKFRKKLESNNLKDLFDVVKEYGLFSLLGGKLNSEEFKSRQSLDVYIFTFIFGNWVYFNGEADGRYSSPGFSALNGTAFIMCSIFGTVLFLQNLSKARLNTPKDETFTDEDLESEDVDISLIIENLYKGPSANIEGVCMTGAFIKMRDWRMTFVLRDGNHGADGTKKGFIVVEFEVGIMVRECVTDRDGKILTTYYNIMGELILCACIVPCLFIACYGHGKKSLYSLLKKITDEKFIEMGKRDMDFAFNNYKKTIQYKNLKDGDDLFAVKALCILQDVFMNTLDHRAGQCSCKEYGLPCKGKTRAETAIDVNNEKGKKLLKHMREAYTEFTKLFEVLIKRKTTSRAESMNNSIASFVLKRLDYLATYDGRTCFKVLCLMWETNFYLKLMLERSVPVSARSLYLLRKADSRVKKLRKRRKGTEMKAEEAKRRLNLKALHRKSSSSTYYSSNADEKEKRMVNFEDISGIKNKISLKRKIPSHFKIRNMKGYNTMKIALKAAKEGKKTAIYYVCPTCQTNGVIVKKKTKAGMISHFKKVHKRMKKYDDKLKDKNRQLLVEDSDDETTE